MLSGTEVLAIVIGCLIGGLGLACIIFGRACGAGEDKNNDDGKRGGKYDEETQDQQRGNATTRSPMEYTIELSPHMQLLTQRVQKSPFQMNGLWSGLDRFEHNSKEWKMEINFFFDPQMHSLSGKGSHEDLGECFVEGHYSESLRSMGWKESYSQGNVCCEVRGTLNYDREIDVVSFEGIRVSNAGLTTAVFSHSLSGPTVNMDELKKNLFGGSNGKIVDPTPLHPLAVPDTPSIAAGGGGADSAKRNNFPFDFPSVPTPSETLTANWGISNPLASRSAAPAPTPPAPLSHQHSLASIPEVTATTAFFSPPPPPPSDNNNNTNSNSFMNLIPAQLASAFQRPILYSMSGVGLSGQLATSRFHYNSSHDTHVEFSSSVQGGSRPQSPREPLVVPVPLPPR